MNEYSVTMVVTYTRSA